MTAALRHSACGSIRRPVTSGDELSALGNSKLSTFAELCPNFTIIAYVNSSANECVVDVVQTDASAPGALWQLSGSLSQSTFDDEAASLAAAFPTPRKIQVLPEDEGTITTIELVVENLSSSALETTKRLQPTSQQNPFSLDNFTVLLFVGTSNGSMLACNAIRGTILVIAQFQYNHDFAARGRSRKTTFSFLPEATKRSGRPSSAADRSASALLFSWSQKKRENQPIVRFAVCHLSREVLTRNPDIFMGANSGLPFTCDQLVGVYVVHSGGKVVYLDRKVLDTFMTVTLNRADGRRPHLVVEWSPTSTRSSFPIAGPASGIAPMVTFVYTLEPVTSASPCELEASEEPGGGLPGNLVSDAAFFWSPAQLQVDALLHPMPRPTETLVVCGRTPAFAVYALDFQQTQLSTGRVVRLMSSMVKGVTKSLRLGGVLGGFISPKEPPQRLTEQPQRPRISLMEADSFFSSVIVDFSHEYGAFYMEGAGRVYLVELSTGVVWRVLKGCRNARYHWWLATVSQKRMLTLVVHLPLRRVVEVHSLRLRRRIAACMVPDGCVLLRPSISNGENPNLLLMPTGEVRQLELHIDLPETLEADPSSIAGDALVCGQSHCGINPEILRSCRSPDEYFDVAMQLSIPLWTALDDVKAVSSNVDRFNRYQRQLLSVCDAVKRRYAPGHSGIRTLPLTSHGVPRGLTTSQCLHYLQLQGIVVNRYARLAHLFALAKLSDAPVRNTHIEKLAAMSTVPEEYWQSSTLSYRDSTVKQYWGRAVRTMFALLESVSLSGEAAVLKSEWFMALQRVKTSPTPVSPAGLEDNIPDAYTFLSSFFCGGSTVVFRRDALHTSMEDAAGSDIMGDLGALLFQHRGLDAFMTHLEVVSELGLDMVDLATITLSWIAHTCAWGLDYFMSTTSLGMLVFVMGSFSGEAFSTGLSQASIPFVKCSSSASAIHPEMRGAASGLLLCCVARQQSNPLDANLERVFAGMVAQLVRLSSTTSPYRDHPVITTATGEGTAGTTILLRLQNLFPNHPRGDTVEAFLQRRAVPTAHMGDLALILNRVDVDKAAASRELTRLADVLYSCCVLQPVGQLQQPSSCFHVSYPWVSTRIWSSVVFQERVLNPISAQWSRLLPTATTAHSTSKCTTDQAWATLRQCCVLVTAMKLLEETVRPFLESPALSFWQAASLPDASAIFRGGPPEAEEWLSGSRSHRNFLSSAAALADLTASITDALLSDADDQRRVSLVQTLSVCLTSDDDLTFPVVPACFRRLIKVLMQEIVQNAAVVPHRCHEVHSFLSLLLLFSDANDLQVDGRSLHQLSTLCMPWSELFGKLSEQLLLYPPGSADLVNTDDSITLAPSVMAACPATVAIRGGGDAQLFRTKLRCGTRIMRELLSRHIAPSFLTTEESTAILLHADTRDLLKKVSTALGLSRVAPDTPLLVILDLHVKRLHSTESVLLEALSISNKQLLARLAMANIRVLVGCCIKYADAVKRLRGTAASTVPLDTELHLERVFEAMSNDCRRWIQLPGNYTREETEVPLSLEVTSVHGWVSTEELLLMDATVNARLGTPRGDPRRQNFFELLFLLAQWASEGTMALPADLRTVSLELPSVADALRKYLL